MNKKENRMAVRQTVEKAVIRDEQNRRIQSAATNPVKEVLKIFHTTLRGLEADTVLSAYPVHSNHDHHRHVLQILFHLPP